MIVSTVRDKIQAAVKYRVCFPKFLFLSFLVQHFCLFLFLERLDLVRAKTIFAPQSKFCFRMISKTYFSFFLCHCFDVFLSHVSLCKYYEDCRLRVSLFQGTQTCPFLNSRPLEKFPQNTNSCVDTWNFNYPKNRPLIFSSRQYFGQMTTTAGLDRQ